ncbi:MAG: glycosyltransferase family 2 protein [Candidatus Solibacter usitatus]|nr:glycosyltransferase family 2 protein [Candidatus Solibacter usitatus]
MTLLGFDHSAAPTAQPGLVSVIIVNWNRAALLQAAMASLLREQGVPMELIVVDNGSTDASIETVRRFAAGAPFPVRLIANPGNRGFCAANNQGIAGARGEFVALLNNDAEANPLWLHHLRRMFDRPAIGMAASKILVHEEPRMIDKAGHLIYPDGQNRGRGSGEIDNGQYDRVEEVLWPDGCACMYRASMLASIGGFDEEFFAYGDDAELGLRARICGWGCLYSPEAVVRHHRGATLGQANPRRITLIERNRVLLAVKLFPGSLLWRNVAYYLARLCAGLWAALLNRGEISLHPTPAGKLCAALALLKGDIQALSMIPSMLRKRRALSSLRKLSPRQVHQLILSHRITLRQLTQNLARPRHRA